MTAAAQNIKVQIINEKKTRNLNTLGKGSFLRLFRSK